MKNVGTLVLSALVAGACAAQQGPPPAELIAQQKAAMAALSVMDGTWRGTAKVMQPNGSLLEITQTERVGSMLDGTLKVIEGRGYMPDGALHFNAFGVVSYDPQARTYGFRTHAQGRQGDFPFEARADGFSWSIKAGPAIIRYNAVIKDGAWNQIGERVVEGQPPMRIFEMSLRKVGATDWPAQGSVPPK